MGTDDRRLSRALREDEGLKISSEEASKLFGEDWSGSEVVRWQIYMSSSLHADGRTY